MVITFTVCFNEYIGNKYTYLAYFSFMDFFTVGAFILSTQVYVKRFGHVNMILIHGILRMFAVSRMKHLLIYLGTGYVRFGLYQGI